MKPIKGSAFLLVGTICIATSWAASFGCSGKNVQSEKEIGEVEPFMDKFKVHRYQFKNGLKLLVVEDHTSSTFAYQTWFRVGSRDETPGLSGLAHLLEHMMFKETIHLKDGEFDRLLKASGAEKVNAFTSRDYTAYVQEMPKDKLDLIAKLEADRMQNLIINEKTLKTELEVIKNERRIRYENSPDGLMYQKIFDIAFTKHTYHCPVIGYQEDLNRASAHDSMKFYRTWYSPNHAIIVVVGDVIPKTVHETVKKYYGDFESQTASTPIVEPEPAQESVRRKNLKLNIQIDKLMMGYHIPDVTSEAAQALIVAQAILVNGKNSRLHRALVETGITSSIDGYDIDDKDPSLLIFGADLQKGKHALEAETVILREIARLAKEPVSSRELARARNLLAFQFNKEFKNNSEKAMFLGRFESITRGFEIGIDSFRKAQTVSAQEVQKAVKQWLNPKNRSVIVGVPK